MSSVADTVHRVAVAEAARFADPIRPPAPASPAWSALRALGTRLWLDTGDIEAADRLWTAEFEALTTNNTLLNAEVQKGLYDETIRRAASELRRASPSPAADDLRLEIAFLLNAVHGLRLARRFSADVSVELHTDLAHDVGRSVEYGLRYRELCPDRFIVKVPLTPAGYLAARRLAVEGVRVNFTLGFSARQNLVAAVVARPGWVNVFMGRLNAFVADNRLGDGRNVGEKASLACQRVIFRARAAGSPTRLIGASMRDASQVAALAGLDVYTMPPKVAAEYARDPADVLRSRCDDDPPVALAEGMSLDAFAAATLWDVPEGFQRAVERLAASPVDLAGPDELAAFFYREGFADLLPDWSGGDLRRIAAEGKIPKFESWRADLGSRRIGLDALMNAAGLASFAADQAALDRRILSLL